jgi:hypothetical protein
MCKYECVSKVSSIVATTNYKKASISPDHNYTKEGLRTNPITHCQQQQVVSKSGV